VSSFSRKSIWKVLLTQQCYCSPVIGSGSAAVEGGDHMSAIIIGTIVAAATGLRWAYCAGRKASGVKSSPPEGSDPRPNDDESRAPFKAADSPFPHKGPK
jgi:hypothetical protein